MLPAMLQTVGVCVHLGIDLARRGLFPATVPFIADRQPHTSIVGHQGHQGKPFGQWGRSFSSVAFPVEDHPQRTARREATSVLLDRRLFLLDDKAYAQFTAALDQPPTENRRLRRLLTTKAAWDK